MSQFQTFQSLPSNFKLSIQFHIFDPISNFVQNSISDYFLTINFNFFIVSILCLLLPYESSFNQIEWYTGYESTIHSSLEDDEFSIRRESMNLLANLLHEAHFQDFEIDFLHKIYIKYLQRLDDQQNSLRVLAAKVNMFFFEKSSILRSWSCRKYLNWGFLDVQIFCKTTSNFTRKNPILSKKSFRG